MATVINAGRVAMVPKGEWASATAYTRLDVVLYNGSSWVAIADSTGQVPAEGSTYWQLLASGVDPSNYYTKTETNTKLEKKANLTSLYRFAGFSIIADGSPEDAAMAFGPYVDVLSSKLDTYCPGWGDVADHRSILQLIRLNKDGSYNSEYLFTGAFGDGLRRAASEAHEMGFNSLVFPNDLVVYEAGVDMLEERIAAVERDKADKSEVDNALSAYATGAEYDSASKRIYLKHGSTRLTGAYVDATAFIKDGMVDNVTISSGYLVITFNTDSGKEPISLAITDIFNASNYYTKAEIDGAGYLTQESDPTVPAWAKASSKPTYTADEVGALPASTAIPSKTSDLTNDSNFVVDADYVHTDSNYTAAEKSKLSGISAGAEANVQSDWSVTETTSDAFIKNKPTIPSKTSDLTNDSGFVTGSKIYYGTCTTAAATDPKVCTVEEFPLDGNGKPLVGTQICVKFSATDTSTTTTPHLNVNGTGAERIWVNSAVLASAKSAYHGYANRYITYMWDGTYWVWRTSGYDANTTYTNVALGHGYATQNNSSAATAITAALGSYALTANGIVSVHFNYDVPANATLNVNGKGAKAIYHRGAAIAAGVIKAGDTATFVFSTYYHLISVDRDESADLTNYYTKTEIDTKIGNIETLLASI